MRRRMWLLIRILDFCYGCKVVFCSSAINGWLEIFEILLSDSHIRTILWPHWAALLIKPGWIYWKNHYTDKLALRDWKTFLWEAVKNYTHTRELELVKPGYIGWVENLGEGVGEGLLPGNQLINPTAWCIPWPQTIGYRLMTPKH